ncbi:MAG: PilZ domain-containing protein [Candidatus Methylomirabilales bacterium]
MRQSFLRYAIQAPVLYKRLDREEPSQTGIGWTEELGERGACLKLQTVLLAECRLGLVIFAEPEVVEAEARVLWVRPGGQRNLYYHGVEFLHLLPAYYQSLLKALPSEKSLQQQAFRRFVITLPLFCQIVRANTPPLEGKTGNISRGGVMISLPQQVPPRSKVKVALQAPQTEPIRGKVRWVGDSRDDSGLIRHGIEFLWGPLAPEMFLGIFSGALSKECSGHQLSNRARLGSH